MTLRSRVDVCALARGDMTNTGASPEQRIKRGKKSRYMIRELKGEFLSKSSYQMRHAGI